MKKEEFDSYIKKLWDLRWKMVKTKADMVVFFKKGYDEFIKNNTTKKEG